MICTDHWLNICCMENYLQKICNQKRRCEIIYLFSLNFVRLLFQIDLYKQGFISVSADEFARGIQAAKWAQMPNISLLADIQGTWLPLEKYLNGLALLVWPDEILAPRATVFLASCVLIVVIYYLASFIFVSKSSAIVSTIIVSFQPWFVWMGGTPMLEMYYFALFFAGLLLLLIWLKEQRDRYWFFAGLCFFLSSGFHVQSWTLINLVNLLILPTLYKFVKQKDQPNIFRLLAFYFLSNGLIIVFSLIEYGYTGEVFAFLTKHTSYSKWFYDGYEVPILEKFLYYPRLIVHNANWAIWVGLFVGLLFLTQAKDWRWKIFPLLVSITGLLLNSTMNIFSGPPSAAPDRYSLFHIIIFSLYVGYGIASLMTIKISSLPKLAHYAAKLIAVVILVYGIWWGAKRIPDYPQGMSLDTVNVGKTVNALLEANPGSFMVELRYWDFLGVELGAAHFDDVVYDRVRDTRKRDLPSVFQQDSATLCNDLEMLSDLRYILLLDDASKLHARELPYLNPIKDVGRWTIFEMIPEKGPAVTGCN